MVSVQLGADAHLEGFVFLFKSNKLFASKQTNRQTLAPSPAATAAAAAATAAAAAATAASTAAAAAAAAAAIDFPVCCGAAAGAHRNSGGRTEPRINYAIYPIAAAGVC